MADKKKPAKSAKTVVSVKKTNTKKRRLPKLGIKWPKWMRSIGAYFAGAWFELRQVHWPSRRSTWGLTLAVILFSLAFAGIILALDYAFNYLFKEVLL